MLVHLLPGLQRRSWVKDDRDKSIRSGAGDTVSRSRIQNRVDLIFCGSATAANRFMFALSSICHMLQCLLSAKRHLFIYVMARGRLLSRLIYFKAASLRICLSRSYWWETGIIRNITKDVVLKQREQEEFSWNQEFMFTWEADTFSYSYLITWLEPKDMNIQCFNPQG